MKHIQTKIKMKLFIEMYGMVQNQNAMTFSEISLIRKENMPRGKSKQ